MTRNFIARLLLLTIALYGILYVVFSRLLNIKIPSELMLGLLFILNAGAYLIIVKTKEKKPAAFVRSYMLTTIGRLLVCGAFIFIYALTHKDIARPFAISFFLLYIVYVILEVKAVKSFFRNS
jgi:CHASE2 domain-containing sensor protein